MIEFNDLSDLSSRIGGGEEIGVSDWFEITQDRINLFADSTEDHQWIHTDPARTQSELSMGTIAHGHLTFGLTPYFVGEIFRIKSTKRIINYGSDKVRFTNMVPVGSRIRCRCFLDRLVLGSGRGRLHLRTVIEIEGARKPALTAHIIMLIFE